MAGLRVGLLMVLTGTLLLNSVWGWKLINKDKLLNFYGSSLLHAPLKTISDVENYDDDYERIPEDVIPEPEGEAVSDDFPSFVHHEIPVKGGKPGPRTWDSSTNGFWVNSIDARPKTRTGGLSPKPSWMTVVCDDTDFHITFLNGDLNNIYSLGLDRVLPVMEAPESCGYRTNPLENTLTVPFTGCNVKYADGYSLKILYVKLGQIQVATATCDGGFKRKLDPGLFPHPRAQPGPLLVCPPSASSLPSAAVGIPATQRTQNCLVSPGEQIKCGQPGISLSDCELIGCCVNQSTCACYYPLNECTADQQFIFAIRYNSTSVPVDPTKLVIPGTNCKPVLVNDKVAIFKFKVTECGVRAYNIGGTKIYLAEVQTVHALNLKYGLITRSNPLSFMIECRYNQTQLLASTGYMVKTPSPSLPSALVGNGLYAVQLRIASNATYSAYLPTNHPPLRLLLGNPVYLELNLVSPKPEAVILVNYCLAYPLSANNALVLVYEGCANQFDPNVSILKVSDLPQNRYQRRFVVTAFQFMNLTTKSYLDEEIYFMCSTEVCRPTEKICQNQCFDGKTP